MRFDSDRTPILVDENPKIQNMNNPMIEQTMKVKMTIVTALIQIIKQVKENHLSDTFWKNCKTHLVPRLVKSRLKSLTFWSKPPQRSKTNQDYAGMIKYVTYSLKHKIVY